MGDNRHIKSASNPSIDKQARQQARQQERQQGSQSTHKLVCNEPASAIEDWRERKPRALTGDERRATDSLTKSSLTVAQLKRARAGR
jgi:hypothetical protein